MTPTSDYRDVLKAHLAERQLRRPGYSLRAFARDLGISASRLSEVLNKRHRMSPQTAKRVTANLGLSKTEEDYLCSLVKREFVDGPEDRAAIDQSLKKLQGAMDYRVLHPDELRLIVEWLHFAILEALDLTSCPKTCDEQERWLAKRLRKSLVEVHGALQRLVRLKLLRRTKGAYAKTGTELTSTHGVPSTELKKAHQLLINRGLDALFHESVERRSVNSLMLGIDRERRADAFKRIFEFCRAFNEEFGATPSKDDVYCLSMQFFPLTEAEAHDR